MDNDTMNKIYLILLTPLFLSGCMMIGMGGMAGHKGSGMHGDSHGSSMNGQTIVKESVVNGIKITAEFPPYTLNDELAYKVTLYDVREKLIISDASISLIVTTDNSLGHDSHSDHGKMQEMKFSPSEINNGTYIFRPSIKNTDVYKFIFVLEKVGNVTIDPLIEVEQTVQLISQMNQHSENDDNMTAPGIVPVVLISAGVMAIVMLFMLRLF